MQIICLEDEAFYALINEVTTYLDKKQKHHDKWVSQKEAMRLLNVKSKTTLQNLRDEGKIRFSQPQKKIILYDRASIEAYLDKYAHDTFNLK
jgi:hypothetical protein